MLALIIEEWLLIWVFMVPINFMLGLFVELLLLIDVIENVSLCLQKVVWTVIYEMA